MCGPVPLSKMARLVIADNARRFGVDWKATRCKWKNMQRELEENFARLNTSPEYPEYYTAPFHAYEGGNLNWEVNFEEKSCRFDLGISLELGLTSENLFRRLMRQKLLPWR